MMLLAPYAGLVADRVDKRKLLQAVQLVAAVLALSMALAVASGRPSLWLIYTLALGLGLAQAFDNPVRQSFISELVGTAKATNAVSLNTVMVNMTRIVGPALAGVLIAGAGAAICFLVNGMSYLVALGAYAAMRPDELLGSERIPPRRGQLKEALRYVLSTPDLAVPLGMMALVGTLAFNFQVVMPVLVERVFGRGPDSLGLLIASAGVGSMVGGLAVASLSSPRRRHLIGAAYLTGACLGIFALARSYLAATLLAPLLGAGAASYIALSNATLQVNSDPRMRGRVLALFSVAFLGSTPLGSPIVGWIAERFGVRASLLVGAFACLIAGAAAALAYRLVASRSKEALQSPS
jgi:MFS family permease